MKLDKIIHSHFMGNAHIQFGPMRTFGLFFAKNSLQKMSLRSSKTLSDHGKIFSSIFSHKMPKYFE